MVVSPSGSIASPKLLHFMASKMRKSRIRLVVSDRVHLEMTPYDLTKLYQGADRFSRAHTRASWPCEAAQQFLKITISRSIPRIEDSMLNHNWGGRSFPTTKTFTNDNSELRRSAQKIGEVQLSKDDLRLLVAAMID